jgi:hypothetical protein
MAEKEKADPKAEDVDKDDLEDGDDAEGTDASGKDEAKPTDGKAKPGQTKTFTQDELDVIVKKRVAKLEGKAAKWDEHVASEQTDAEKVATAKAESDRATAERLATADAKLVVAEIRTEMVSQGVDPEFYELVMAAVANEEAVTVEDDGAVKGVAEAIKRLLASKPKLKADPKADPKGAGAGKSGGEFKGRDGKTAAQSIAEAEAAREQARLKGDRPAMRDAVMEGIRLKLAKARSTGDK